MRKNKVGDFSLYAKANKWVHSEAFRNEAYRLTQTIGGRWGGGLEVQANQFFSWQMWHNVSILSESILPFMVIGKALSFCVALVGKVVAAPVNALGVLLGRVAKLDFTFIFHKLAHYSASPTPRFSVG